MFLIAARPVGSTTLGDARLARRARRKEICRKALALDPRARFQSAGELGRALDALAPRATGSPAPAAAAPVTELVSPREVVFDEATSGDEHKTTEPLSRTGAAVAPTAPSSFRWLYVGAPAALLAGAAALYASGSGKSNGAPDKPARTPTAATTAGRRESGEPPIAFVPTAAATGTAGPREAPIGVGSVVATSASASVPATSATLESTSRASLSATVVKSAPETKCGKKLCVCDDHPRPNIVNRGPMFGPAKSPSFHQCGATSDCTAGHVCVDEGYCKPACAADGECTRYPYANMACRPVQ